VRWQRQGRPTKHLPEQAEKDSKKGSSQPSEKQVNIETDPQPVQQELSDGQTKFFCIEWIFLTVRNQFISILQIERIKMANADLQSTLSPVSSSCRSQQCAGLYKAYEKPDCWKPSGDTVSMAERVACSIC